MNEVAFRRELSLMRDLLLKRPAGEHGKQSLDSMYVPTSPTEEPPTEELLADIRSLLKYVVFDLEATRRENRYLRQMLESRTQRDRGDEPAEQ